MGASVKTLVAIGSYGETAGLSTWWWDGGVDFTAVGTADIAAPSFACWHPTLPLLYAVSEVVDGSITALAVADDGSLEPVASVATGGSEPCWVVCDPAGTALLAANYDVERGQSSMAVIRLAADGSFTGDVTIVRHSGSGPVEDRQKASHIHQVVPTPHGTVLASDLGADQLTEYEVSSRGVTDVGRTAMPAGSGPRHMALSSDGSTGFVTGELDGTITVIRRSAGGLWVAAEQVPTTRLHIAYAADAMLPSQVRLAGGDRWLLVANRGTSTLAALSVSDGLRIVSEISVTEWPRHFTVARASVSDAAGSTVAIVVAGQRGGTIEALNLDTETGELEQLGAIAEVPQATCVAIRAR
ncbi:MAG: beta-propeller fold lactonase family protein [Nakamurella sp.]